MEVTIYKLRYNSNREGLDDLISKGVIDEEQNMINGTQAYYKLDLGCFDIMTTDNMHFDSEIHPLTPSHEFAGWQTSPVIEE